MGGWRNLLAWIAVAAVAAGLWYFGARVRLHLVDERSFVAVVALAALALTALYWWGIATLGDAPGSQRTGEENR